MKNIFYLILIIVLFNATGCNPAPNKVEDKEISTPVEIAVDIDSSLSLPEKAAPVISKQKDSSEEKNLLPDISGTHQLTLQWISWDKPGSIQLTKTGEMNTYKAVGSQIKKDEYLKMNGRIKIVTPLKLEFNGIIKTKSNVVNNGQECVRESRKIFLATKGRKYWRMQEMENCEGGRVVDYIDIYFNCNS